MENFFNIIFEEWQYHLNNIIVMVILSGFASYKIYKTDKKIILATNVEKGNNDKKIFLDFFKSFVSLFIIYVVYIAYRYYNG